METKKISISLHENESYIRKRCENCDDILIRPMRLGEGHKADCLMVYIEVAVSNMMLDDSAIGKMINHFWKIPEEKIREFIRRNSLGIADVKELSSMEEVFGDILSGNAVFFLDGYDKAMKISSKGYPGLAVSEVKTEKVLRGSYNLCIPALFQRPVWNVFCIEYCSSCNYINNIESLHKPALRCYRSLQLRLF